MKRQIYLPRGFASAIALILLTISVSVSADEKAELSDLTALAESGDPKAQLSLGMRYRDGKGVPKDYVKALQWYRRCADQGDAEGLDNVGFMYLRGWGVPENDLIAAGYFKASAKKKHAQGQFNLGNSYFSGQGVEQNYESAIANWQLAADQGHPNAIWRLATLYAAGEGLPKDLEKAKKLCLQVATKGHADAALLLGEILAAEGKHEAAHKWWNTAVKNGSSQAKALLELDEWRRLDSVLGKFAFVEVDHLYQGWNNCGATSIAMLARHFGADTDPYVVKRLCPRSPIATGTDWADLLAVGEKVEQEWDMVTFSNDDEGFTEGVKCIRDHLDADRPVVIDFTYMLERDGKKRRFGHTLLVVGYHSEKDLFVLKNPNQPPPGIEIMSTKDLKSHWYSRGYSRLAKGRDARPLILMVGE